MLYGKSIDSPLLFPGEAWRVHLLVTCVNEGFQDACEELGRQQPGLLPRFLNALTGLEDLADCARGDGYACVSFGLGNLPIGKAGRLLKLADDVIDGARAVCSFSGDTRVLMADGTTKPIDEIRVGDEVMATDPETGEQGPRKVTHVWIHDDKLTDLVLDNGAVVTTTEDHPFWNATDHQWQRADSLGAGEILLGPDGRQTQVVGLRYGPALSAPAYNLTVAEIHTYYVLAGNTPVLVHNTGPACRVSPVASDWATKGAHVHIGGDEVRIFPDGNGGIGAAPIRLRTGTASDKSVQAALDAIRNDPQLRADMIAKARSAMEHMNSHNWNNNVNRASEMHFLIKALEAMG
jgi:hypothetical protein